MIVKGTKFTICDHHELKEKGWTQAKNKDYFNLDFGNHTIPLLWSMIANWQGRILTVLCESHLIERWYQVEENFCLWPVATFLKETELTHPKCECQEGMTPIDGWFICKHCGTNLREIR